MRLLRFLSRVAFICNICYLLASVIQYIPNPPEGPIVSNIIVLGYFLAIILNLLVSVALLITGVLRKKPLEVPRWLVTTNLIFMIIQSVILYLQLHS